MRLNVSAWAIRKPVPSIVLFLILTCLGLYGFKVLPVSHFPNIDIPVISVQITQEGAAPSELLNQITKKVEDSISSVTGVKHIVSSISEGVSQTTVEFVINTNTDRALNDVKDAVTKIRSDLPSDINEPLIQRFEVEGLPILTYVLASPSMSQEELSWFVEDIVTRELKTLQGVGEVSRLGGIEREIRVILKPDRLLSLGITAAEVSHQLKSVNIDLPGGRGEMGEQEQAIRTLGSAKTLEGFAKTTVILSGGRTIRLEELADIYDGGEEAREYAEFERKPVVGFSISRAKGASDVSVSELVAKKITELEKQYAHVQFNLIEDNVSYTKGVFTTAMQTLLEGALLSVLVVFLFLRDWRATFIAATALPLSIIPTFWIIHELNFSLNMISMLAVTLVTGILVDDAIVEIENIVRHMRSGKPPYTASLEAADEIGLAVIAITFTIIAVFVPVAFMPGISGQFFRQFGLTVAIAVFISLMVARLITPMLAAYFLRSHKHDAESTGPALRFYERLLMIATEHKYKTLGTGLVIFVLSLASTQLLPTEFTPKSDMGRTNVIVELPPGSRLSDTKNKTDEIVDRLKKIPEVKTVFVLGGNKLPSLKDVRMATLSVSFVDKTERSFSQRELETRILDEITHIADIRAYIPSEDGQREAQLIVRGNDEQAVMAAGKILERDMRRMPTLRNVVSTVPLGRPELQIIPKLDIMAELGITTASIAETIRVATIGDVSFNLPKFNAGDRQIPIRIQLSEKSRTDLTLLKTLRVPTGNGSSVPLNAVVDVEIGNGPAIIDRYDRQLKVGIEADLTGIAPLGQILSDVKELPSVKEFPETIEVQESGDAEAMVEVFGSFMIAIISGILLMLGVLVLLFGSFLQPFTILFSLPLSIGGAILGLVIAGKPISLPVFIGILMLMGIVAKNAIMLVDFALEAMANGVEAREAVLEAGRKRARPIVMTTLAMTAGMFPAVLGFGHGEEFRSPMAIAVIGGLLTSTVLSLVFVPSLYLVINDLTNWLSIRLRKLINTENQT